MSFDAANDLLNSVGGPPGFKFVQIGDTCRMFVTHVETRQQTDFATGKPKFYDNGDPMMQTVVTGDEATAEWVRTGEKTRLYVKGEMLKATKKAMDDAGGEGWESDAKYAVRFTGTEETSRGFNMKLFAVKWERPTQTVDVDDF